MKEYKLSLINLYGYKLIDVEESDRHLKFDLKLKSKQSNCPKCNKKSKTIYDTKIRSVRHTQWFDRQIFLHIKQRQFKCQHCRSRFWEMLPGIAKYARRTETLKKQIAVDALNGLDNKLVAQWYRVGQATVQRDIAQYTDLELRKKSSRICPRVMGIDEHYFTKRRGFHTTICDLERRRVFDITLGRSEKSLESYFLSLKGKNRTKIVVMDLSSSFRAVVKKYFPKALIVADRFHVVRLMIQRFLDTWKLLDPVGRHNKGLISLFRRKSSKLKWEQERRLKQYLRSKPGLEALYEFKNEIHELLNKKNQRKKHMGKTVKRFLSTVDTLEKSGFKPLVSLAETFKSWDEEILRMIRFPRSNGVTEGFHNKMETISRRAYGFRNFNNYRARVLLQCA